MAKKNLNIGIVGYGFMGRTHATATVGGGSPLKRTGAN